MSATLTAGFDVLCDELLGQLNSNDVYAQSQESSFFNEASASDAFDAENTSNRRTMNSEHHGFSDNGGPDSSFA